MKLSEDLEYCILSAMLTGDMEIGEVQREEFSKTGQVCLQALEFLSTGAKPPFSAKEVYTAAMDLFGANKSELYPYVKHVVKAEAGKATKEILESVRNKLGALRTIQTLSNQISEGKFDLQEAKSALEVCNSSTSLVRLSELQGDSLVESLGGYNIDCFPQLQEATGGFFGLWVLGGEPAIGKSTLALQLALSLSQQVPTLFYDFENGPKVILHRLGCICKTVRKVREKTRNIYLRESIKTLAQDLKSLAVPSLVVVDSFQSIPTRGNQRRQDLDGWLGRFEALKKDGHSILLVSEINRSLYDKATVKGFKETGEIEYKADTGIIMLGDSSTPELHIVKNRHRPFKGLVSQLVRVNELTFQEIADGGTTGDL